MFSSGEAAKPGVVGGKLFGCSIADGSLPFFREGEPPVFGSRGEDGHRNGRNRCLRRSREKNWGCLSERTAGKVGQNRAKKESGAEKAAAIPAFSESGGKGVKENA